MSDDSIAAADHVSDLIIGVLNDEFRRMLVEDRVDPTALFAGIALALHAMAQTAPQRNMPLEMQALLAAAGLYLRVFHLMHGGDWRPNADAPRRPM